MGVRAPLRRTSAVGSWMADVYCRAMKAPKTGAQGAAHKSAAQGRGAAARRTAARADCSNYLPIYTLSLSMPAGPPGNAAPGGGGSRARQV